MQVDVTVVQPPPDPWRDELRILLRGISGGFLIGTPLLYTLEVWTIGSVAQPPRMLATMAVTFAIVWFLIQTRDFGRYTQSHWLKSLMLSVKVLSTGYLCGGLALFLLRLVTLATPLNELLGKVIMVGIPFTLGVALAGSLLDRRRTGPRDDLGHRDPLSPLSSTLHDLDATLLGALIVSLNTAPTDEITVLATAIPPLWLLLVVGASLTMSYVIVFVAGFSDQERRQLQQGFLQRPFTETLVAYLVSLVAALAMLCFFQKLSFQDPWPEWLSSIIVLGFPASIGGAAGRIA